MQRKIPVTIMRGGTSRALFFQEKDLPQDPEIRDRVISIAFGSPDPYGRQINGLGGATSTTSKVAVISPRVGEPNTVNYTFGQVSINNWLIDRKGNCGNISSAVGPYAIDEGMVEVTEPVTLVKIFNTNTQKYINAQVPVENGKAKVSGDYAIAGIPGNGAKIGLEFQQPGGSVTGKLLPTGNTADVLETGNYGPFTVSIVDAANPLVFVKASDLGLQGTELPPAIDSDPEMLAKIESIRAAATVRVGLAKTLEEATQKSPAVPKIAFVSPAVTYASTSGVPIKAQEIDVTARIMSMGKLHSSYAITGAICTAGAAKITGSVVWEMMPLERKESNLVRLGHPGGTVDVEVEMSNCCGAYDYIKGTAFRTARRLMDGFVYIPEEYFYKP
jgi:2-methylaconitate cis-trans-isomerase PrpF